MIPAILSEQPMQVGFKVKQHTRRSIEMKIHYQLSAEARKETFRVESYFFIPDALGVNSSNYGADDLLGRIKNHLRFTTPRMPLNQLVRKENPSSPLGRIQKTLGGATVQREIREKQLVYEMKILVNVARARLREHIYRLRRSPRPDAGDCQEYFRMADTLCQEVSRLWMLADPAPVSGWIRKNLVWLDESISLIVEDWEYRMYQVLEKREATEDVSRIREILRSRFGRQEEYRREQGYPSLPDKENPEGNELLVYRNSILKKWSQSALYLNRKKTRRPKGISEALAALAAGLAMSFTVAATFLTGWLVPSGGAAWAALVVVVYIFKDRIKDTVKRLVHKIFPRLIPEDEQSLVDPSREMPMGRSTARFQFLSRDKLPRDVKSLRREESNPFRQILPDESVLLVEKDLLVQSRKILKQHFRLETITEILRFNLDDWFVEMDEPRQAIHFYRNGQLESLSAPRVYHVNLIVRLRHGTRNPGELMRYRLVFNRKKILRIESVNESEKVDPVI